MCEKRTAQTWWGASDMRALLETRLGDQCTYSFLDLTEFFELLAKRGFFGVPCQAAGKASIS